MKYNSDIHHRQSIRLQGYDYSQKGMYFVTICAQNKECLFGKIENSKMILNDAGNMIAVWWQKLFEKFSGIVMDEYVVMPNHLHGIIQIIGNIQSRRNILGENMVSPLRNKYDGQYIHNVKQNHWKPFDKHIWQKNYYEHIIRNEKSLANIREYIITNPQNWKKDDLYM